MRSKPEISGLEYFLHILCFVLFSSIVMLALGLAGPDPEMKGIWFLRESKVIEK